VRKILIAVFAANLILAAVSFAAMPAQVAIHFGGGGEPDSWASKEFNTAIFLVLEVPFFLLFYYAPVLTGGDIKKYLNVPNKEYWLRDDNLALFHRKFGTSMAEYGVALFVLLFGVKLLTLQANLSDPVRLDGSLFMVLFVLFMSYTLWWLVRLVRGFAVPTDPRSDRSAS